MNTAEEAEKVTHPETTRTGHVRNGDTGSQVAYSMKCTLFLTPLTRLGIVGR